ncbi:MAG: flagellar biosynthesis protein FlhF [Lachnospiraceae bacterium]|nr:flagellar biosynthesis protein FlhF [Lachnospiraceae bacterium]
MVIKKFIGKTEEDATAAAKKELGESIVIMNVRQVNPTGFFAFLKKKQTEITVALEEEREKSRLERGEAERKAVQEVAKVVEQKGLILNAQSNTNSIEQKLDSLQTLLEKQLKKNEAEEQEKQEKLPRGIQRTGKKDVSPEQASDGLTMDPKAEEEQKKIREQEKFIRLLYNTMIENEVDEKYANQIMEEVDKSRKPNTPYDYILANIYQKIILNFGKSEGITPAENGPKVVFFIGPTGVGKTTTIAKLASSFVVGEKKRLALLTADTYRIAATEQLRTYAQILEVPFQIIYSPGELADAIAGFEDFDYVLVDTSGHSHRNEEQLSRMREYLEVLKGKAEIQAFLVMSANTKYKDLIKIAENYKEVADYQLIFTKIDETTTLGSLLNVKLHMGTPIAYVTYGQNVPNDIECFNPQKTVKQLLGGKA